MVVNQASTIDQEIVQIQAHVNECQRDIGLLKDALDAIEQNKPRPQLPDADNIHTLVKELMGATPRNLEEQRVYSAKLEAAKDALRMAVDHCREKTEELKALREQKRKEQETVAFEEMKVQAEEFNRRIDEAVLLLAACCACK